MVRKLQYWSVPDPDLKMVVGEAEAGRGAGGGGGAAVFKKIFWPFGPQFGLKIRGGRAPPLDPPLPVNFTLESCLPFV